VLGAQVHKGETDRRMQVTALSENQDKQAADTGILLARLEAVEAASTPSGAYQVRLSAQLKGCSMLHHNQDKQVPGLRRLRHSSQQRQP
jgi:hypothetical protein